MSGMPFSPYSVTGPHFHPPIVINSHDVHDPTLNNADYLRNLELLDYKSQEKILSRIEREISQL